MQTLTLVAGALIMCTFFYIESLWYKVLLMVVVMNSYVGFNKTKPTPYLSISHFPEYVDPTKDR